MLSFYSMNKQSFLIRASPFVFLKWLVVIQYGFSVLPLLLVALLGLRGSYEGTAVAGPLPFDLLVALVMTALQVLIIGISFAVWYFPVYEIGPQRIIYRRGGFLNDKLLVLIGEITHITMHQGPLARRFDYGTIFLHTAHKKIALKDIPDPERLVAFLEDLVHEAQRVPATPAPQSLTALIADGENQFVEFKASINWDYHQQRVNKALALPVMKNVAGFMNSSGGSLLIGVTDEGEIVGLQPDLDTMHRGDADGYENHFNNHFGNMIGLEYRRYVRLTFPELEEKMICLVEVRPGDEPVFLRHKGQEEFYIRAGNGSRPLPVSKATRYIQSHFAANDRPAARAQLPAGTPPYA